MQVNNFAGKTIGIMVASGFDEDKFIAIQRAMLAKTAKLKIISRDAGLTNSWNGTGWGMSYPVDSTLSTTLAIDYDALIIPTGDRHVEKLMNEVHAKRVLRAFLREDMPVMMLGEAIRLLGLVEDQAARAVDFDIANTEIAVDKNLVQIPLGATFESGLEKLNDVMVASAGESQAA
ncbi:MAG: peptidase, family C56 [Candidatus Puniceispirillum sp.]|jgi:protease I|uniref:DJ-1/PfpI family protein n=1 Tax=Candidatus Puniceispirillum sp. TaxID=2026719 RepID=UPI001EB32082|nr:peptidase, family C56 [Candidatus Puniceispirillum sp.]MBT6414907.1 peptidase, family C56 [Candidatus Puniceispirillum sp.]MBT6566545.1 peptidase, family C56 [Candidatus Puniceispirillum sp.]